MSLQQPINLAIRVRCKGMDDRKLDGCLRWCFVELWNFSSCSGVIYKMSLILHKWIKFCKIYMISLLSYLVIRNCLSGWQGVHLSSFLVLINTIPPLVSSRLWGIPVKLVLTVWTWEACLKLQLQLHYLLTFCRHKALLQLSAPTSSSLKLDSGSHWKKIWKCWGQPPVLLQTRPLNEGVYLFVNTF